MIVEALLQIQERYGYLPDEQLISLARGAGVLPAYVQDVAGFFPSFRFDPPKPVDITIRVCDGMTCALHGSQACIDALSKHACDDDGLRVRVEPVSCLGRCDRAPAAMVSRYESGAKPIGDELFVGLGRSPQRDPDLLGREWGAGGRPKCDRDSDLDDPARAAWEVDVYRRRRTWKPYQALGDLGKGNRDAHLAAVIPALRAASLAGMGGALAQTARKWGKVAEEKSFPKYIVANGDESEPATFKDRELLLRTPHLVVEGMLIAAAVLGAARGYVYIRHEYAEQIKAIEAEIKVAKLRVPEAFKGFELRVFTSPGRYICGEQSALLEVLEDRRAQPREAPPEIEKEGLYGKPTLVNNVETYAWVPGILLEGAEWFRDRSLRFFSISGHVRNPGVYEVSVESTLGELIELAGGMSEGREFAAVAPSGPSGGFLPPVLEADELRRTIVERLPGLAGRPPREIAKLQALRNALPAAGSFDVRGLPLDGSLFRNLGLMLGAGIVVYGKTGRSPFPILDQVRNCLEFFHRESCGKCTPCRLGCEQLVYLGRDLDQASPDRRRIGQVAGDLAAVMEATSICSLGRTAAYNPLITALKYF